jgi:hypothetical protein
MWAAMHVTEAAVDAMRNEPRSGRTEVEVCAEFHRSLVVADGAVAMSRTDRALRPAVSAPADVHQG